MSASCEISNNVHAKEENKDGNIPEEETMLPKKILTEDNISLTEDTSCGIWFIRGRIFQKFANKKVYVLLYGVVGCIFSASYSYSTGTITTIEKRFKIPSRNTGIIAVGNDISQLFISVFLSYYGSRGHRPRWIAFGLYTVVMYCMMTATLHFMYGSGEDALLLTTEYGATYDDNTTLEVLEKHRRQTLCFYKNDTQCETHENNLAPQSVLFLAQLISGVGGSLYYTLGISYMDDNIKKSKTPALISLSFFMRMLGPALGYSLASFCLKLYISPNLTPTINTQDPRWLGAWWLGWIIISFPLFIFATLLGLFPKELPRAAARKKLKMQDSEYPEPPEIPTSLKDMIRTFKRLLFNIILMLNNLASVFYFLGYLPYWIFMPKYIEIQYRQSASISNLMTGTVGLVFSAFGILLSGIVITRYKPRARYLAMWNVIVGAISVLGIISYTYLGCEENDNTAPLLASGELKTNFECNANCSCDFVKYSPVCSEDRVTTFISACHAGCKKQQVLPNGTKLYFDCSCITRNFDGSSIQELVQDDYNETLFPINSIINAPTGGMAVQGSCPVDCTYTFYAFLSVVCLLKFSGAAGRASNVLVSVRCVDDHDKAVAMGFGVMIMSLFAFIPSPIMFGVILDQACLVWGKTCFGTGNCWLYNGKLLRYTMNLTAAFFVTIGTMFDVGVWYYVKDVKIFDDEGETEKENGKESIEL